MPRRVRRDLDESAATAGAIPDDSPPFVDSASQQAEAAPDSQPAPKERPTRRRAPKADAVQPAESSSAATESVASEAPKRRSRRTEKAAADQAVAKAPSAPAETAASKPSESRPSTDTDGGARRRVGGRRSAAEAQAAFTVAAASSVAAGGEAMPAAEGESAEDQPSSARSRRSRRGGRRRRGKDGAASSEEGAAAAVSADAEPDDAEMDEPVQASLPAESEEPDAGGRGGRSRRGGRRRKGADDTAGETGESDARQALPELTLPPPYMRERWSAPPVVPTIEDLGISPVAMGISAVCDAAAASVVIDGRRFPAHLFFVNAESAADAQVVARQIRRAASAGVHLHTCVAYLPLKNAYGERSFAAVDDSLRAILDADPDGYVILRVQCVPTNFWVRTHPDQMARTHDGAEGDVSVASRAFWSDALEALAALASRLAQPETIGHGRVFALHLDKGEWFNEPGNGYDYSAVNRQAFRHWLHERYQSAYALRAAWFDSAVTFDTVEIPVPESPKDKDKKTEAVLLDRPADRKFVDYALYASSIVGSAICALASAVKALTGNALLVFFPYGYLFEFASRADSGHQALGQLLECSAVDALTGPNSYFSRSAGGVGGFAAPVDSVLLHGKLWLVEDDTKTYLASEETPDGYNPKIGGEQETVMVHRRNFFAALAHGCGLSWMDLWGQGWLDSDPIWDEIGAMVSTADALRDADGPLVGAPEVAVVIDEASFGWVRGDAAGAQLQSGLIVKARDLLLRSGASVGLYLQGDVGLLPDSVKVVFFLNALQVSTEQRQAIRDKLQRPGKALVWLYAPGLYDESGPAQAEVTEIVGMPLRPQPWNARVGTIFTDERHPAIERLHGGKRMGTEEILNPSFTFVDPQAVVLGEYGISGNPSIGAKVMDSGWRSIFIGEPHLTGELIRGILRYAGVHLYDVQDDIVYARGEGFVLVHAPYSGQRVVHLPRAAACYSVFEGRLISQSSAAVRVYMRGRSTHLLLWGDMDSLARRTGRNRDDLLRSVDQRDAHGGGRSQDEIDFDSETQESGGVDALESVLGSVVREAFDAEPASARIDDEAARREASRITEAVLADLADAQLVDFGSDETAEIDIVVIDAEGDADPAQEQGQSRSSRRRRWRRRRAGGGAQQTPQSEPLSVDQILGDLGPRRREGEGGSAEG